MVPCNFLSSGHGTLWTLSAHTKADVGSAWQLMVAVCGCVCGGAQLLYGTGFFSPQAQ